MSRSLSTAAAPAGSGRKQRQPVSVVIDGGLATLGNPDEIAEALGRLFARLVLDGSAQFTARQ